MISRTFAAVIALAAPIEAAAFCGFFVSGADSKLTNDATQVVLMRKGQRTVLSMSNNYQGPAEDFALVVPVPVVLQKDEVKTLPAEVFDRIDRLTAPRLVEYWEQDPCPPPGPDPLDDSDLKEEETLEALMNEEYSVSKPDRARPVVKVEARFEAGEYDIVILSAEEADGLERWLSEHKYRIPTGAAEALAPYIRAGMKFFVAKVDIERVQRNAQGQVVLSPLRFHYEEDQLRLPVRLGLLNSAGQQDLLIYTLALDARLEVANHPNVFVPTNLEVVDEIRNDFSAFYAQLFDGAVAANGGRAVVTEYAWSPGSCDPCATQPLKAAELLTLGGDVFEALNNVERSRSEGWVLTRLHARYDRKNLSEDLVFAPAKPVVGGRAAMEGQEALGVEESTYNAFQARYIIRNYWAGEVKCRYPQWNRWGQPPAHKVQAAQELAQVKRGTVPLAQVVRTALPALNLPGQPPPDRKKAQ